MIGYYKLEFALLKSTGVEAVGSATIREFLDTLYNSGYTVNVEYHLRMAEDALRKLDEREDWAR